MKSHSLLGDFSIHLSVKLRLQRRCYCDATSLRTNHLTIADQSQRPEQIREGVAAKSQTTSTADGLLDIPEILGISKRHTATSLVAQRSAISRWPAVDLSAISCRSVTLSTSLQTILYRQPIADKLLINRQFVGDRLAISSKSFSSMWR